jgi:hypothetical protein
MRLFIFLIGEQLIFLVSFLPIRYGVLRNNDSNRPGERIWLLPLNSGRSSGIKSMVHCGASVPLVMQKVPAAPNSNPADRKSPHKRKAPGEHAGGFLGG